MAEQRLGPLGGVVRIGPDDLGQAAELLERVTFGDPLGAEDDVDPVATVGQVLGDVLGRARVDGASEHDQRAVPEVRRDLVDGSLEDRHRRPEELVDRGTDHHDHGIGPVQDRGVIGQLEATGGQQLGQEHVGACLEERHPAGLDRVQGLSIGVEDPDAEAGLGEHQAERQTNVATAAEHDDVKIVQGYWALLWQTR